jgi:acetyltransferase-like isoleucine patch superfamily enzyme
MYRLSFYPSLWAGPAYCRFKGCAVGRHLATFGIPRIIKCREAKIIIGDHVVLASDPLANLAGLNRPVSLAALSPRSVITIGDHSGLSGTVIYSVVSVTIGSFVNLGVNVSIYDTDFHPVDLQKRRNHSTADIKSAPVVIEDDVWVGANVTILKGVTIGKGSIIGTGSVVTKNVAPFSLCAGVPARFIKRISSEP